MELASDHHCSSLWAQVSCPCAHATDVDYEDFPAFSSGTAIPWFVSLACSSFPLPRTNANIVWHSTGSSLFSRPYERSYHRLSTSSRTPLLLFVSIFFLVLSLRRPPHFADTSLSSFCSWTALVHLRDDLQPRRISRSLQGRWGRDRFLQHSVRSRSLVFPPPFFFHH